MIAESKAESLYSSEVSLLPLSGGLDEGSSHTSAAASDGTKEFSPTGRGKRLKIVQGRVRIPRLAPQMKQEFIMDPHGK